MTVKDPLRKSRAGAHGRAAAPVAAAVALTACSSGQVPSDATMSITPEERSIRITEFRGDDGTCRTDGSRFVDVPMLLSMTAGGSPVADADVSVYVDFAANTYSGHPVLALYEDRNGNGIVDADSELASGERDSIARVRTDRDGAYRLLLRADIACPYRGEIFAYAGPVSATASFEVKAVETIEPEQPERIDQRLTDADADADADTDTDTDTDPLPADTDPFDVLPDEVEPETVELESEPDVDLPDADADPDGADVDPAPQPVRCVDASQRRSAVVCTLDPEPGS